MSIAIVFAALACLCAGLYAPAAEASTRRQHSRPAGARVPVVVISPRGRLSLDGRPAGTIERPARLTAALEGVFRRRRVKSSDEHPVIIKAPAGLHYAAVEKVADAVKKAGGGPITLVSNEEQLREARRKLQTPSAAARPADSAEEPAFTPGMRDPSRDPEILKEGSVVVSIAPDGNLYVGRRVVAAEDLEVVIRSLTNGVPEAERVVYIRSHLDATYAQVVSVIETVRKAGVTNIGLVAEKRRRQ